MQFALNKKLEHCALQCGHHQSTSPIKGPSLRDKLTLSSQILAQTLLRREFSTGLLQVYDFYSNDAAPFLELQSYFSYQPYTARVSSFHLWAHKAITLYCYIFDINSSLSSTFSQCSALINMSSISSLLQVTFPFPVTFCFLFFLFACELFWRSLPISTSRWITVLYRILLELSSSAVGSHEVMDSNCQPPPSGLQSMDTHTLRFYINLVYDWPHLQGGS